MRPKPVLLLAVVWLTLVVAYRMPLVIRSPNTGVEYRLISDDSDATVVAPTSMLSTHAHINVKKLRLSFAHTRDEKDWKIEGTVGRGTFGVVSKGSPVPSGKFAGKAPAAVAIKCGASKNEIETQETLAKLCPEFVPAVFDSWSDKSNYCMVMELMEPMEKRALNKNMTPRWRLHQWGTQFMDGLNCLHKAQYVHGDVKVANLLVSVDNTIVKLADFGSTRQIKSWDGIESTPGYQDPTSSSKKNLETFAAGIVLLEIAYGCKWYEKTCIISKSLPKVAVQTTDQKSDNPGQELELSLHYVASKHDQWSKFVAALEQSGSLGKVEWLCIEYLIKGGVRFPLIASTLQEEVTRAKKTEQVLAQAEKLSQQIIQQAQLSDLQTDKIQQVETKINQAKDKIRG